VSLRPDGAYRCDRCGTDVGNGAVTECAVVSDMEVATDDGVALTPRVLHFCRVPNRGAPEGCAAHVLGHRNLADYHTQKETSA
jgi:hypothetical protein